MNTPTTIPATETPKLSVLKADTAYQGSLLKGNSHWQALCTATNVFLEPLNLPNYGERVEAIEERFGPAAALLILLGNFNYQVSNGGHDQYFHNGYADGVGGFFQNHDSSIPLHKRMTELFRHSSSTTCRKGGKCWPSWKPSGSNWMRSAKLSCLS